jgi:hypothetical protein
MQRIAYGLFPLIAVAVAIFIVVFMFQINSPVPPLHDDASVVTDDNTKPAQEENIGWLDHFSLGEDKGYLYPVNELTLKLDTNDSK